MTSLHLLRLSGAMQALVKALPPSLPLSGTTDPTEE